MKFVDHVFDDQVIDQMMLKIILPEGSTYVTCTFFHRQHVILQGAHSSLKAFEIFSSFQGPGKSFKTGLVLECFGI